jgi:membrane protein implicated in regulation of membrane protease activity
MPAWSIWAIAAAALAAGEIATPGLFFLGPVAIAALVPAVAAAAGAGLAVQLIAFVVGTALSLLILRPVARRHLRVPAELRTGVAALEGARATVVDEVRDGAGTVRIGGEVWTARPYVEGDVIEAGAGVDVVRIEGATARVMR